MLNKIFFAVTIMCIALSCVRVIRVQDPPVVVKVVEKEPLILTEEKVVFPPTPIENIPEKDKEEETTVKNSNIPLSLTFLVNIEGKKIKNHGIISPTGGDFSLLNYERKNGITSIYISSENGNIYRFDLPHLDGRHTLTGHLVNK